MSQGTEVWKWLIESMVSVVSCSCIIDYVVMEQYICVISNCHFLGICCAKFYDSLWQVPIDHKFSYYENR